MPSEPVIIDDTINPAMATLVRAAAKKFDWGSVHVRPLSRFGYSGAQIFVIRPDYEPNVPHVLKVATRTEVDREKRSIDACKGNIKKLPIIQRLTTNVEWDGQSWGAICYEYFASEADPVDLTDLYADCMGQDDDAVAKGFDEHLKPMIEGALDSLKGAHVAHPEQQSVTYKATFNWYLRAKRPSRVDHVVKGGETFEYCGIRVDGNPLDGLKTLLAEKTIGYQAVVIHGDLHLSNIVVDGASSPNLIDFAWARRRGHRFLDFALLESSMRFMSFPHDVHPAAVLAVDREVNADFDGGEADQRVSTVKDKLSRHRLEQMIAAVRFVRGSLRATVGTWNADTWSEYQRTLYLLLSGQQRLASFPLMRTIVNLDQLRKELGL